jgi:hypothetical protein
MNERELKARQLFYRTPFMERIPLLEKAGVSCLAAGAQWHELECWERESIIQTLIDNK